MTTGPERYRCLKVAANFYSGSTCFSKLISNFTPLNFLLFSALFVKACKNKQTIYRQLSFILENAAVKVNFHQNYRLQSSNFPVSRFLFVIFSKTPPVVCIWKFSKASVAFNSNLKNSKTHKIKRNIFFPKFIQIKGILTSSIKKIIVFQKGKKINANNYFMENSAPSKSTCFRRHPGSYYRQSATLWQKYGPSHSLNSI